MRRSPDKIPDRKNEGILPLRPLSFEAAGERVLALAAERAGILWGKRLIAAYALGSLAHGGFSIHVSDVDLGLVLDSPLVEGDANAIDQLSNQTKASGAPLAERLSVYWGSLDTVSGNSAGGRFPSLDLLDLKQFGRLLAGQDVRDRVPTPTLKELVVSSAEFALKQLSTPEVAAQLQNPSTFASASTKTLTKRVLYPVRFLFTASTGQVGMNDKAVEHFSRVATGPAAELARKGLEWRFEPPDSCDHGVVELLRSGVLPLYRTFLADYERRLQEYGELELAQAFREWRQRLA